MFQFWYTGDFIKTKVVKFIGSLIQNVMTLSVHLFIVKWNLAYRETEFWKIYHLPNSEVFQFGMDFVGNKVLQCCRFHKNCNY